MNERGIKPLIGQRSNIRGVFGTILAFSSIKLLERSARERSQIRRSRPSWCCSRREGLGKHVAVRHKRPNGVETIESSHRSLRLTSHRAAYLATDVVSRLHSQCCVMTYKVVSTFLPDVHSDVRRQNPQLAKIHSVSDVYLSRIFHLKCLPCDWCLLFATGPTLALKSGNWLTRRQYESLTNTEAGRIIDLGRMSEQMVPSFNDVRLYEMSALPV